MSAVQVIRPGEVPVPPWEMSVMAGQVYRRLGSWTFQDPENGWVLAGLVDALCAVAGWIDDKSRVGIETFLDPDRCPWWALRWCGQLYGVVLLPAPAPFQRPSLAIEEAWREEIRTRPRWRRGHPDTIIAAARRHMVPDGRVRLRERYNPALGSEVDAPYHFEVRVRASDVLDGQDDLVIRDILAAKPLRLVAHIVIADDQSYDDLADGSSTYDALPAEYPDYDSMESS